MASKELKDAMQGLVNTILAQSRRLGMEESTLIRMVGENKDRISSALLAENKKEGIIERLTKKKFDFGGGGR